MRRMSVVEYPSNEGKQMKEAHQEIQCIEATTQSTDTNAMICAISQSITEMSIKLQNQVRTPFFELRKLISDYFETIQKNTLRATLEGDHCTDVQTITAPETLDQIDIIINTLDKQLSVNKYLAAKTHRAKREEISNLIQQLKLSNNASQTILDQAEQTADITRTSPSQNEFLLKITEKMDHLHCKQNNIFIFLTYIITDRLQEIPASPNKDQLHTINVLLAYQKAILSSSSRYHTLNLYRHILINLIQDNPNSDNIRIFITTLHPEPHAFATWSKKNNRFNSSMSSLRPLINFLVKYTFAQPHEALNQELLWYARSSIQEKNKFHIEGLIRKQDVHAIQPTLLPDCGAKDDLALTQIIKSADIDMIAALANNSQAHTDTLNKLLSLALTNQTPTIALSCIATIILKNSAKFVFKHPGIEHFHGNKNTMYAEKIKLLTMIHNLQTNIRKYTDNTIKNGLNIKDERSSVVNVTETLDTKDKPGMPAALTRHFFRLIKTQHHSQKCIIPADKVITPLNIRKRKRPAATNTSYTQLNTSRYIFSPIKDTTLHASRKKQRPNYTHKHENLSEQLKQTSL
jgi:hypothetical protein